jgi:geranylgeranyl diphosphate synthase type II
VQYNETYKNYLQMVEKALEQNLPPKEAFPPIIQEAMADSLLGGGKRLRPVLALATAETAGGEPRTVLSAACALEMIHAYSLIHDDLPSMDNDDLRRGKPSNHKKFGEAVAILAGDALLTQAFFLLADASGHKPGQQLQVIREIAYAAGTFGMIGGQVEDTCSEGNLSPVEALNYIHRHKTGALFCVSVRTGAILAGATKTALEQLTSYGENLGLAFQITDDILDVTGDEAKLGKPVGSDAKNQKLTYPLLFGLAESRQKAEEATHRALEALAMFGEKAEFLRQMVQRLSEREA